MIKDFFRIALIVWIILVLMELFNPGMVVRYISLEYWFYFLLLLYIINKIIDR